jgi:hypothetical protein
MNRGSQIFFSFGRRVLLRSFSGPLSPMCRNLNLIPIFAVYRPFKAFSIFIRSLRSRQCVCRFGILMGRSLFETRATYFTRLSTRQKVHQTADRWEGMQTRHGESLHRTTRRCLLLLRRNVRCLYKNFVVWSVEEECSAIAYSRC